MGLFSSDKPETPATMPTFTLDDETQAPALDRTEVINYMVALSKYEYYQLLKVTSIYREAERQVAEVMVDHDTDGIDEVLSRPRQTTPSDDAELDKQLDEVMTEAFIETPPKGKQ